MMEGNQTPDSRMPGADGQALSPDEKQAGWSTGKKVLVGCGCSLVVFLILLVVAGLCFLSWLGNTTVGELPPETALMAPDAQSFLLARARPESKAIQDLFARMNEDLEKSQQHDVPKVIRNLFFRAKAGDGRRGLAALLPAQLVAYSSHNTNTAQDEPVILVSIHRLPNVIRFLLGLVSLAKPAEGKIVVHATRDETHIYRVRAKDGDVYAAKVGNSFVFGQDPQAVERALDRLKEAPKASSFGASMQEMFSRLPQDKDFLAVAVNDGGLIDRVLKNMREKDDEPDTELGEALKEYVFSIAQETRAIGACGDLTALDALTGQIIIDAGSEDTAFKVDVLLDQAYAEFCEHAEFDLAIEKRVQGQLVTVSFAASGLGPKGQAGEGASAPPPASSAPPR